MQPNTDKLPVLLKLLKLSQTGKLWKGKGVEAKEKGWSHSSYLTILCEEEVADRYHKRVQRYIRESHGSSAFLMGKFMRSSRNPLNPSKVFEKATHY